MYATHAVLPLMKAQGSGHIVNISSVAGRKVHATDAVYAATKWGVGAFSEGLRQEVEKHHIRVTIIEPGAVATEMQERVIAHAVTDPWAAEIRAIAPLAAENIAAAIVYAVTQPEPVAVSEMLITPTEEIF